MNLDLNITTFPGSNDRRNGPEKPDHQISVLLLEYGHLLQYNNNDIPVINTNRQDFDEYLQRFFPFYVMYSTQVLLFYLEQSLTLIESVEV